MMLPEKIETERLILERPVPAFALAEEVHRAVMVSIENLHRWLPWARFDYSAEEEFTYIYHVHQKWQEKTGFAYFMRDKGTQAFLGIVDLVKIDEKNKIGEIGYWLSDAAVGKGYMTEAVKALEVQSFAAGLHRMIIRNDTLNLRSANVAARAGYHLDGIMREDRWDEVMQKFSSSNIWSKIIGE